MFMSDDDPNEKFYGTNGPRPVKHQDHPKDLKPPKGTAGGKPKATMRSTTPSRGGRSGRR